MSLMFLCVEVPVQGMNYTEVLDPNFLLSDKHLLSYERYGLQGIGQPITDDDSYQHYPHRC